MSARVSRLKGHAALMASGYALVASMIVTPVDSQAKVLASAVLNVSSLVWYRDVGDDGDRGNDQPLLTIIGASGGDLIVNSETDNAQLQTRLKGTSLQTPTEQRVFGNVGTPLDIGEGPFPNRVCQGDCPPHENNNFDQSSIPDVAAVSAEYAYADQVLRNATFGYRVENASGGEVVPSGAEIGLRAEASQLAKGTGSSLALDVVSGARLTLNNLDAEVRANVSFDPITTYFKLVYDYALVAALSGEDTNQGRARAALNFSLQLSGFGLNESVSWAPLTGNPNSSQLSLDLRANGTQRVSVQPNTEVYSPDIVFLSSDAVQLLLSITADAGTRSRTEPVPAPATIALLLLGITLLASSYRSMACLKSAS